MGLKASDILRWLLHPDELRSIIQWKTWHDPVYTRDPEKESKTLQRCFYFLDFTSRSFAPVIQELLPELLVPITLFYLALRGLDTVEDDMSIPLDKKVPILRNFHKHLQEPGWTFNGNGSREKDRQLLVEFDVVIEEFAKMKPEYQEVILEHTKRMGDGMADFCIRAEKEGFGVDSVDDYDLYCYYVAGQLGTGLSRLFIIANVANPGILEKPELANSMGLLLQKVNIIRDIHEDWEDKRHFWPKQIWGEYVKDFDELLMPENKQIALHCSSHMVYNALSHVEECLWYLGGLREQSVFNFCAIPQAMAIATLDLCFKNYSMFQQNIKITKGQACQTMIESTQNHQLVCKLFLQHIKSIQKKNNDARDPHFQKISKLCGHIEQYIEKLYPTLKPRAKGNGVPPKELTEGQKRQAEEDAWTRFLIILTFGIAIFVVIFVMVVVGYFAGARYDLMWAKISGDFDKMINPNKNRLASYKSGQLAGKLRDEL